MSLFKPFCVAAALSLTVPVMASASTSLATISYDYGTAKDQPTGWSGAPSTQRDPINANNVRMFDTSTASGYKQFVQVFDLAIPELAGATITSFKITVQYSHVDPAPVDNGLPGVADDTGELWYARILGDNDATLDEDFFKKVPGVGTGLTTDTGTFSFTLDASNDGSDFGSDRLDTVAGTNNTAFQSTIDDGFMRLRFREESGLEDIMWINTADLEVFGTAAPIPLPASGLLLLGAVGGVVAMKRRKASS